MPLVPDQWPAAPIFLIFNRSLLKIRQPMTDQARKDVERAAGAKADDDAHRPRRIGLRTRNARKQRQRGGARSQMQKLSSVGKYHFHHGLPSGSAHTAREIA